MERGLLVRVVQVGEGFDAGLLADALAEHFTGVVLQVVGVALARFEGLALHHAVREHGPEALVR